MNKVIVVMLATLGLTNIASSETTIRYSGSRLMIVSIEYTAIEQPRVSLPILSVPESVKNDQHSVLKWQIDMIKPEFLVRVSIKDQTLTLIHNGEVVMIKPISTAEGSLNLTASGESSRIHNHIGVFTITSKEKSHFSSTYGVPMPYAMRYHKGHFIHATRGKKNRANIGSPASHGCVRMLEEDARELFFQVPVGTIVEIR